MSARLNWEMLTIEQVFALPIECCWELTNVTPRVYIPHQEEHKGED